MFKPEQFDEALLKRFLVEFAAGSFIFKQNERGNTMYIIIEGKVQLSHKIHNKERVVAILNDGEVAGERAICGEGPYRRTFTAIAMTDATMLEFTAADLKYMQSKVPDLQQKILTLVIQRLDKANFLNSILQLPDPIERLAHCLIYFSNYFGSHTQQGTMFRITNDVLANTSNVALAITEECIKHLIKAKAILKVPEGYVVPDENAILAFLSTLKERAAA